MSEIGFALVGLGMGRNRARLVHQTDGARLVSVVDINAERAQEVAGELECGWTTELAEVLADDAVDVVFVMTPSGLHGEIAIAALEAGKHTVTTKPMEVTLEKCDAMIAAQKKSGKHLGVDFNARYTDTNQKIKFAVENGLFGKLILGEARLKWYRAQNYYDRGGWRGTWKLDGGGSLANQTVHQIDLLQWFMGQPRRVIGKMGVFNHQIETEDLGMAIIEFASGAVGGILGTTTFPGSPYAGVEVHGSEGGVLSTNRKEEPHWFFLEEFADRKEQLARVVPHTDIVQDVLSALRDGTPLLCGAEDGRRSVALLSAVYESARNGGAPVEL